MVIVQHVFSLVRPALNVVGVLISLAVTVCAPPVVAVGSLVKSYGWPVFRVLLWLVRNVYRVVFGALFVARISAWLHVLAARLGMGVGRTLTNAALSCIRLVLSVVSFALRVVLAIVNIVPACVWRFVVPRKVNACACRFAAAVDTGRRRVLFVVSVLRALVRCIASAIWEGG